MLLLLLAAAAQNPPAAEPSGLPPAHNYLRAANPCDERGSAEEIIVCAGSDPDARYRLKPLDGSDYAEKPVRLATKLGGGTAAAEVNRTSVGGFPSNRIMITLKFPF